MKYLYVSLSLMLVSFTAVAGLAEDLGKAIDSNPKAEEKVKTYVKKALIPLHNNAVFVTEVKKHNAKAMSLDKIKEIDKKWQAAEDYLPIQEQLMDNTCAREIIKIIEVNPAIKEAFVMGNQGAVVGENDLTSDYWQGDEAKWKNSFNGGKGGIDVGKVKHDKSTNSQLQQISIPVIDGGKVIGAITFGLDISKL
ncbi:MAG: hypothetical protein MK132_24595 [Lentisphaerales bacterium]|nr:hypothetical protein [Lentisphaerales bacterium]